MSKILVIGSSGTVGAEIARLLKSKNQKVARATRSKELDADQVYLDLTTQDGLKSAITGVDKIFMLSPPGHVNQNELLNPVIDEAKKSGIKKIVLMTAMGANADEASPLRKTEIHLQNSGIQFNIIRPNWFMQNFNTYWIQSILNENKILLPVGQAKGSFIDTRDIARVAVELLTSDKFNNQEFDITGPEALNHAEVAEILSKVSDKKITYQDITPSQMYEGLVSAGLPKPYSEFMLMILEFFKLGYSERVTDSVEKITGKRAITFETYAKDYKDSWVKI
jgi:uncharacterized protein YbjT (DUF2867 family)